MDNLYVVFVNDLWEDTFKSHFFHIAKVELIKRAKNTTDFVPIMREYKNVDGLFYKTGSEWTVDKSVNNAVRLIET